MIVVTVIALVVAFACLVTLTLFLLRPSPSHDQGALMAQIDDLNAAITQLSADVDALKQRLQPPVDLTAPIAQVQALDAEVQQLAPPQA